MTEKKMRHIVSLSGGKDSSALAAYMRDRVPEMEYVFCDTRKELVETYEYLDKLQAFLGRPIIRLYDDRGFGYPKYYEWRTRSGCYFCFFQRRAEWVGLLENHPDLFEAAKEYEKVNEESGERYTWNQKESLDELARPERVQEIKDRLER